MATHSSILDWEIPWTEERVGLQSMELQKVGQDLVTKPPSIALNCYTSSVEGGGVLNPACLLRDRH